LVTVNDAAITSPRPSSSHGTSRSRDGATTISSRTPSFCAARFASS
jgi:hypothetical protein